MFTSHIHGLSKRILGATQTRKDMIMTKFKTMSLKHLARVLWYHYIETPLNLT